jgi:hypothetical protein
MLMQRRSFLVGLGSLFVAPAVVKASSLMPLRGEVMLPSMTIPSWCPPGWAPANGHLVDHFQFPELHAWFKRTRQNGAHLGGQFKLPGGWHGWSQGAYDDGASYSDQLNRAVTNPCIETVSVPLIAVKPMARPNGTVAQPGMMFNYTVNAEVLRASYAEPSLTPDKQAFRDQWKFVRKGTADSSDLSLEYVP